VRLKSSRKGAEGAKKRLIVCLAKIDCISISNPILIFCGIFSAYMPYSASGYLSVHVCVRLRQKKQKRISIYLVYLKKP